MNPTKNILFFISIFFGLSLHSYSQSSYHKSKTDKFGGIGVSVDIDSSVMLPYIVDILSAKPGAMAGLRSGDHIISINGWKTKGKAQEKIAGRLRGRVGSEVNLMVNRGGKDTVFSMKREYIEVNEKAGNLCESLDTVLKSINDSFNNLKGERNDVKKTSLTFWSSKIQLPGFEQTAQICYEINYDHYELSFPNFKATYFNCRDSLESLHKFNELVADISGCLNNLKPHKYQQVNSCNKHITFIVYTISNIPCLEDILEIQFIPGDESYYINLEYNRDLCKKF